MTVRSNRSVKRHSSTGLRQAPPKEPRRAPSRGKPGLPKGISAVPARRTPKSAAAVRVRTNNARRKKNK
jgi:hypothetical protein